jgi:hypothetical protein
MNQHPQWFGGKVLRNVGGHWVDVLFDDGDEMCVKIQPGGAGTAWRWLGANETDSDQTVADADSGEEPLSKRHKSSRAKTSRFVGVTWSKACHKWAARITHDSKLQVLGYFDDEQEAARAVDTAARSLRGDDAHGGRTRSGNHWLRLNFPTEGEVKTAKERGALLTEEEKAAAAAASEQQGPSVFVGVSWRKERRKWKAQIRHDGEKQHLGYFDDELEAARAVDTVARQLRGEDAHGGQSGKNWNRLNFPTEGEVKGAKDRGALLTEEDKTAAAAASELQGPSAFVGVSWNKRRRKWMAQTWHGGKNHHLSFFDDEREAARAVDTAARRLRGEEAHSGGLNRVKDTGAEEDTAAMAAVASEQQGPSAFVGVCWHKQSRKWAARFHHDGEKQYLGYFDDEREAARAVDTAARRLRGDDAHGGRTRSGTHWMRLNFPTEGEVKRAKDKGMPLVSVFMGVSWAKRQCNWKVQIAHDGKKQHLGYFDHEREAAQAFDTAARRLRGDDAHGGRAGQRWNRLNFPSEEEVKRAEERGAQDRAVAAVSERQGPSTFVGVSWDRHRKWVAQMWHDGKQQHLGYFDDEREAARAVDTAARRLRGKDAHGGRAGQRWNRLNFPTEAEAGRAKALGMPSAR